jgi:hypothetical protein
MAATPAHVRAFASRYGPFNVTSARPHGEPGALTMMNVLSNVVDPSQSMADVLADAAADRIVMREAMEALHRLAHSVSSDEFEALMPLAICMFAHCLGVTRTDWISPPTVRFLLSGSRHQMFEWLDDVFEGGLDIVALSKVGA